MENQPRRRSSRKKVNKIDRKVIWIAAAAAVVVIAAICLIVGLSGKGDDGPVAYDPDRGPLKELTVGELTRQGETMVGKTSYLAFEYPYAFSDLIGVTAINDDHQTALAFYAKIDGLDRPLYTIWFNGSEGQTAGTLDLQDGQKPVLVTVVFHKPAQELSQDGRTTFFATQETVNDVLVSIQKDQHFVMME